MGWARELEAAGVSGARALITTHGAMSAIRNPKEMPADTRECARFADACSRTETARASGATGREEHAEELGLDT
jgi:hypothetical protein